MRQAKDVWMWQCPACGVDVEDQALREHLLLHTPQAEGMGWDDIVEIYREADPEGPHLVEGARKNGWLPAGVPEEALVHQWLEDLINLYRTQRDTRQLRRPAVAYDACWAFVDDFVRFARYHGFEASRVLIAWPYLDDDTDSIARKHYVAEVDGLYVDWTANQFAAPPHDKFPIPYVFDDLDQYVGWIDEEVWGTKYGEPRWMIVEEGP